jgi:hypothetical protein
MNASEAEIAAEERRLDAELEESSHIFERLPIRTQVAHYRRRALHSIKENRRRLRDPQLNTIDIITKMWRDGVRREQVRLLKLRAWRSTGVEPGKG